MCFYSVKLKYLKEWLCYDFVSQVANIKYNLFTSDKLFAWESFEIKSTCSILYKDGVVSSFLG